MKTKATLFLLMAYFLCFSACTYERLDKEEHLSENLNPYDFIGKIHNDGLLKILSSDKILKIQNDKKTNTRSTEFDEKLKDQILEESLDYTIENVEDIDPAISRVFLSKMQQELYEGEQVIINGGLEYIQKYTTTHYYTECLNILKNTCIIIEENKTQKIYDFNSQIQLIEQNIISSNNLPEEDKIVLLIGMSVIKNSFEFWINNEDLLIEDSITRSTTPNWLKKFYTRLEQIVQDDAVGAIGGAAWTIMSGATAGSLVFGPGGAAATIAAGAVGGAITGSILGQAFAEEEVPDDVPEEEEEEDVPDDVPEEEEEDVPDDTPEEEEEVLEDGPEEEAEEEGEEVPLP